jgi:2-polyprenyl-3-methyl-5-hydroxy-6-metoxy-1,4-benzoquinol methylase
MDKHEKQILHSWEVNASAWTESIRSKQIESRRLGTNRAIVDAVLSQQPKSVLDVGCGEGWLVRELIQHNIKVVGTDGAAALVDKAKELGVGEFHVLTYEEQSSTNILSKNKFDAIVFNFALISEHIDTLLHSLSNLLSEEGKIIIQTVHPWVACGEEPYKDEWRTETFSKFGSEYKAAQPWFFRTLGSWIHVLNAAGLKIVDCREPLHPSTSKPLSLVLICTR